MKVSQIFSFFIPLLSWQCNTWSLYWKTRLQVLFFAMLPQSEWSSQCHSRALSQELWCWQMQLKIALGILKFWIILNLCHSSYSASIHTSIRSRHSFPKDHNWIGWLSYTLSLYSLLSLHINVWVKQWLPVCLLLYTILHVTFPLCSHTHAAQFRTATSQHW